MADWKLCHFFAIQRLSQHTTLTHLSIKLFKPLSHNLTLLTSFVIITLQLFSIWALHSYCGSLWFDWLVTGIVWAQNGEEVRYLRKGRPLSLSSLSLSLSLSTPLYLSLYLFLSLYPSLYPSLSYRPLFASLHTDAAFIIVLIQVVWLQR